MSAELERMYSSVLSQQVPAAWARVAYPSNQALPDWVASLKARVEFFREWLTRGEPSGFWLPAFFAPEVCQTPHFDIALGKKTAALFPGQCSIWWLMHSCYHLLLACMTDAA